jgi:hypothetical protein
MLHGADGRTDAHRRSPFNRSRRPYGRKLRNGWKGHGVGRDVDTIVRPPEAPPEEAVSSRMGRWGPRRSIVVAVILLVGMLTAAGAWLANAEPLGTGSFGFGVADSLHATYSDVDALGVSGRVIRIPAAPGLVFRYRFTVGNAGSLPVTITDAGSRAQPSAVSTSVVATKPNMSIGGAIAEGFVPFHPLELDPGSNQGSRWRYCSPTTTALRPVRSCPGTRNRSRSGSSASTAGRTSRRGRR